MVKKLKSKELLKRLDNLQHMMKHKDFESVFVSIEEWIASDEDEDENFIEYCERLTNYKTKTILIDDLILQTNMYLDMNCVFAQSKKFVKELIELSITSETEFLKKYILAFEDLYVVKGNGNRVSIMQEAMLKNSGAFVKDFYEQYKVLSVEELVERYKDQRFFEKNRGGKN